MLDRRRRFCLDELKTNKIREKLRTKVLHNIMVPTCYPWVVRTFYIILLVRLYRTLFQLQSCPITPVKQNRSHNSGSILDFFHLNRVKSIAS